MRVLLALLLLAGVASAQTLTVTTDRTTYAQDDTIVVTVTARNTSADTLRYWEQTGGARCNVGLSLDNVRIWSVMEDMIEEGSLPLGGCTVTEEMLITMPPGAADVAVIKIAPRLSGLPATDGTHRIRAWRSAAWSNGNVFGSDSTEFEMPRTSTGLLYTEYHLADSTEVAARRHAIAAEVVHPGIVYGLQGRPAIRGGEVWETQHLPLESTISAVTDSSLHLWVYPIHLAIVAEERRITSAPAEAIPPSDRLAPAAPNPFTARTTTSFTPGTSGPVHAAVFDVLGRHIATLFEGTASAGTPLRLDVDGRALAPGVYVLRLTTAQGSTTARLVRAGR